MSQASKKAIPGRFLIFYPKPTRDEPIEAKLSLTAAYKEEQNGKTQFYELDFDDSGWHVVNAKAPRPSFDTLQKLIDYYSTYMSINVETSEMRLAFQNSPFSAQTSKSVETVFEGVSDEDEQ